MTSAVPSCCDKVFDLRVSEEEGKETIQPSNNGYERLNWTLQCQDLINNRRRNNTAKIQANNYEVISKSIIRCLGVMFEAKLNFKGHLDYTRRKTTNHL